ncbi:MAG: hypothetical protein GF398_07405 [Chitinivibrionales bacterium]|nr:hypothetical protein [Chitinivibrionales bacterium]
MKRALRLALIVLMLQVRLIFAESIIIDGSAVPHLVGEKLSSIRMIDADGKPIPFQIDELTSDGEYLCDRGAEPNDSLSNGILDSIDEIVFLRQDASPLGPDSGSTVMHYQKDLCMPLEFGNFPNRRRVYICNNPTFKRSTKRYMTYDHSTQLVKTPWYYAEFGNKRFHFVRAGVKKAGADGYIDLTNELRIQIKLRALWGLLPISYNEESMICHVKRYKTGPIRLVRRGDFHLSLGLGIKGSRASVNQICYPQMVRVPVYVHLPIRFHNLFKEAWIEMSPVIRPEGKDYDFKVKRHHLSFPLGAPGTLDTLVPITPTRQFMRVDDGSNGYGWLLETDMGDNFLDGSGFLIKRPSERGGIAHCGFRLAVRDLPRGRYLITNWVMFADRNVEELNAMYLHVIAPTRVRIGNRHTLINRIRTVHTRAEKR